jgi:L-asparaginase
MDRVCIVYTGGTIGMKAVGGVFRPALSVDEFLDIAPELRDFVEVDLVGLSNKDSTNITPIDWANIARAIYERRNSNYKGFVVAHGTDTMHFCSSAVAFALGKELNFPVVFTGAQAVPALLGGDARRNLVNACRVALTDLAEVVISFGDYVFRACRTQKVDERKFAAFESPAFPPVAYITETIDVQPLAFTQSKKPSSGMNAKTFKPHFETGILQIELIPGLEPELVRPMIQSGECNGLILKSFGAGNVPTQGAFSFLELIEEAVHERGIPVILTSQFPANSTTTTAYEPGVRARQAGAIPTGNMTSAAAVAKFRWVLAQARAKGLQADKKMRFVAEKMMHVYVGEMSGKR